MASWSAACWYWIESKMTPLQVIMEVSEDLKLLKQLICLWQDWLQDESMSLWHRSFMNLPVHHCTASATRKATFLMCKEPISRGLGGLEAYSRSMHCLAWCPEVQTRRLVIPLSFARACLFFFYQLRIVQPQNTVTEQARNTCSQTMLTRGHKSSIKNGKGNLKSLATW